MLFNISHRVSKRQSFPESLYLGKARLLVDVFSLLPGRASQSPCLLLTRSWLAGWHLFLGGISGSHAHFAFNAQNWELSQIAERVEVRGWINQSVLLLPGCVSVGTSLWSDTNHSVLRKSIHPRSEQRHRETCLAALARHPEGISGTAPPNTCGSQPS